MSTLTKQQAKKLDDLVEFIKTSLAEDEGNKGPETPAHLQMSPSTYVLIGLVSGAIAAVVLVAYMSKQNMKKKKYTTKSRRGGPSSGSPLTSALDEEKSA